MFEQRDEIEFEHLLNKLNKSTESNNYMRSVHLINRIGTLCQNNSSIKERWKKESEENPEYKKLIRKQIINNSIPKFMKKMYRNLTKKRMGFKKINMRRIKWGLWKLGEWVWSWSSYPSWKKYTKNLQVSKEIPTEKNINNTSSSLKMAIFDTAMTGIFAYLMYDYVRDIKVDIEDMRLLGLTGTALTRGIVHRVTLSFLAKAGAMTAVNTIIDSEKEMEKIEKERKKEMEILSSYISPTILNKIKQNEKKEVEATIVFTDVRGYTKLSTEIKSHELAKLLSLHFSLINKVVEDYNGVMMKYIGDSAMFAFNLHHQEKPVDLAIETSISIQKEMFELNQYIQKNYNCKLPIGIGIATGNVTLANIGGNYKDFTLIGDAVNLASRLNGIAKEKEIIIDLNSMNKSLRGIESNVKFKFENIGKVNLKGKGEVEAHKVLFNIK